MATEINPTASNSVSVSVLRISNHSLHKNLLEIYTHTNLSVLRARLTLDVTEQSTTIDKRAMWRQFGKLAFLHVIVVDFALFGHILLRYVVFFVPNPKAPTKYSLQRAQNHLEWFRSGY